MNKLCRSGAYAPCAYPRICSNCANACFYILFIPSAYACGHPRICSNCAIACFHILFIPSAYACGYPRICSNCANACFHILGFIASVAKQSSNSCLRACDTIFAQKVISPYESKWVFGAEYPASNPADNNCNDSCAGFCAYAIQNEAAFRTAISSESNIVK